MLENKAIGGGDYSSLRCARCHGSPPLLIVRREHICRGCFTKYVATKVLKRLEANKIRGGFNEKQKTLLIPVSFGVSSVSLLHVLDEQLRNRSEHGRHAGYTLHIVIVDQSVVIEQTTFQERLELLKERFPSYAQTVLMLEDFFGLGINLDGFVDDKLSTVSGRLLKNRERFQQALRSMDSASSRMDMVDIARRKLILAFAQKQGCDGVLYGDSTTRLAERTLSETAKGRGGSLPWLTGDNVSFDGIICTYPMRDLLRKELKDYANIPSPSLAPLIQESPPQVVTSSKNATIDGLMSLYFESVEQSYPNIVANVVRTSSKLKAPIAGLQPCTICREWITNDTWGEDQEAAPSLGVRIIQHREDNTLCHECARMMQERQ